MRHYSRTTLGAVTVFPVSWVLIITETLQGDFSKEVTFNHLGLPLLLGFITGIAIGLAIFIRNRRSGNG